MTDPLARYVRGDGTTKYYDTDAMAADLRRMIPLVEAAEVWYKATGLDASRACIQLDYAVRRYREGA